jgi:hypothetical protein
MTEDEAMTKWCPFAMAPGASFALNRGPEGVANGRCMCLASACMAWRWNERIHFWGNAAGGACSTVGDEKPPEGFVIHKGSKNSLDGFCGLAGRP